MAVDFNNGVVSIVNGHVEMSRSDSSGKSFSSVKGICGRVLSSQVASDEDLVYNFLVGFGAKSLVAYYSAQVG